MLTQMRRAIQDRFRKEGIEIRKTPSEFRPLSVFNLAVQALMAAKGDVLTFVQVGANDGKYVDPLRSFVLKRGWKGILVEPQPDVCERLKANYAACADRLIFENVAISSGGNLTLYLPPEGYGPSGTKHRPDTVASGDPHVIARQLSVAESELRRIEVPALTLDTLLAKHGITEFDLLQIDTEGFDWLVLQTLDLTKIRPFIIQLETGHLARPALTEMAKHLNASGYDVYYGGYQGDCVAVRSDFVLDE